MLFSLSLILSSRLIIRMNRQSPQRVPRYFFLEFIYANQILLQPCHVYRKKMIFGNFLEKPSWDRLEQERIVLMRGTYYPLGDIIEMTEQYATVLANQQQLEQKQNKAASTSSMATHQQTMFSSSQSLSPSISSLGSHSRTHAAHTHRSTQYRPRTVGYTTAALTVGNKTIKPIIQKGEYDESIQIHIKPLPPSRAPKRIQALRYYNYMA